VMSMSDAHDIKNYDEWVAPNFPKNGNRPPESSSKKGLPTADDVQTIYKQAYDEGFKKGHEDGLSQSHKEISINIELIANIIRNISSPYKRLSDNTVNNIKDMALIIAGQIIRREISADSANVVSAIRKSLEALGSTTGKLSICLNPLDVPVVAGLLSIASDKNLILEEDPSITRGGCKILSQTSTIDATIEEQIRVIASEIIGGSRANDVT